MSSTAISNDASQETLQQQASATDTLVEYHPGLVVHIAKRYARSYQGHHILDLDDPVQEGVLGLIHAAEKFDARKGFQFSTYATYWIRWAIGQAIMHESRTTRLPSPIWYAAQRLVRTQAALWQQKQKEPSLDELVEAMRCEKEQVLLLPQLQHELVSLEQPVSSEQEVTLFGDQITAPDDTEQWEQQREVGDLLKHLSPGQHAYLPGQPDRTSWLPGHILPEYPLHVALKFHNAEHEKEEKRDKSPEGSQSLAAATTSGVEAAKRLDYSQPPAQFVRQRAR